VPLRVQVRPDLLGLVWGDQPDAALVSLAMLGLAWWLLWRRPGELAAHAFLLFTAGWASSAMSGWAWTGAAGPAGPALDDRVGRAAAHPAGVTMSRPITLLIADDHPIVREGLPPRPGTSGGP